MPLADLPLDPEQGLLALRLDALGQLPVEIVRLGALLARELEDAHLLEAHLLDELEELAELLVGLARKPTMKLVRNVRSGTRSRILRTSRRTQAASRPASSAAAPDR